MSFHKADPYGLIVCGCKLVTDPDGLLFCLTHAATDELLASIRGLLTARELEAQPLTLSGLYDYGQSTATLPDGTKVCRVQYGAQQASRARALLARIEKER